MPSNTMKLCKSHGDYERSVIQKRRLQFQAWLNEHLFFDLSCPSPPYCASQPAGGAKLKALSKLL